MGREGAASRLGEQRGSKGVKVAKAAQLLQPSPAAQPCLILKEALESNPESFKGLFYIRGLQKGFTPRL